MTIRFIACAAVAASLLCYAAAPRAAAPRDDYSKAYTSCMDTAASTLAMRHCMSEESQRQDHRLNAAYGKAMAGISKTKQAQLRDVQRQWIKYRDASCALYTGLTGGTIDGINASACLMRATRERADALEAITAQGG